MTTISVNSNQIIDIADILSNVRALNHAVLMAASGDGVSREAADAIQSVCDEINNKLLVVRDRVEDMVEASQ
jgi:diacylglycerol kinase family enzyme